MNVDDGFIMSRIHPGRLTWNLQITHLERKLIFQTSMIMFHVNLPGCKINQFFFCGFQHFIMIAGGGPSGENHFGCAPQQWTASTRSTRDHW